MKITPIEIRQKSFKDKVFGGYEKEEVDAFLSSLSQVWENMLNENRELRIRLESTEKEVQKLREVENSLFKTLKTAEDTSNSIVEQATKKSELTIREAEMQADALLKEAKWQAKSIREEAEDEAKRTYNNLQKELKSLEREFISLEHNRDSLLAELQAIAQDVLDKIVKSHGRKASGFQIPDKVTSYQSSIVPEAPKVQSQPVKQQEAKVQETAPKVENDDDDASESFFDQLK